MIKVGRSKYVGPVCPMLGHLMWAANWMTWAFRWAGKRIGPAGYLGPNKEHTHRSIIGGNQTINHRAGKEPAVANLLSDQARGAGNGLRWKYRWVNILGLVIIMTPQWWIARGASNCLRWKYRWVNILRLELFMTPQWWIARGASNCLRWKYWWVKHDGPGCKDQGGL
ncbi:hypothetical protein E3N88_25954 [Mikania micrantha]|uniref:Uncharacterized protein n=1 Tax=Mikania micrantha TaxID=192012 RepID=A0A5N6N658_9ASTR|nr:hypothetical protein E3N88_25954 [Mikania micrantha]